MRTTARICDDGLNRTKCRAGRNRGRISDCNDPDRCDFFAGALAGAVYATWTGRHRLVVVSLGELVKENQNTNKLRSPGEQPIRRLEMNSKAKPI